MSNDSSDTDIRCLVVAITDFLRDQLQTRTDLLPEDRDCLEISIQCLEMAYDLDATGYVQYRFARPLLDIFNQVTHPVPVRAKLTAETHKDEGNSFMRQGMHQRADEAYTRALQLDPWNAVYYCNRASARIEQQLYFEAISDCRHALLLNPDYAKAYARMGQAYALIRRPREAARCFRQALELEPDNDRFRHNLQVAESQVPRSDAVGLFESLLGSIFGMRPQGSGTPTDVVETMPSSFMIIAESHPATRVVITEPAAEEPENSTKEQPQDGREDIPTRRIFFPSPYGVIDGVEEELSVKREQSDDAGEEGQGTIRQERFLEIPYFSDPRVESTPRRGEASSSKTSETDEGQPPVGEEKKISQFNITNKKRHLSRPQEFLPRSPIQRQNLTQLPEAGRDSLRYPLSEINQKLQAELNQAKEFAKRSLIDCIENLRMAINQTAGSTHRILDDINQQMQTMLEDTTDLMMTSFSKVQHDLQNSKSVTDKPLYILSNIKEKILSTLNETKEFIRTSSRNIKNMYRTPEDHWEDFLASIHDMDDQIQDKLSEAKRYVLSSLSKVNSNFLVPDKNPTSVSGHVSVSQPDDSHEGEGRAERDSWKSCFDETPCFRHKYSSCSLIQNLRVSPNESRNTVPYSLNLTAPLVEEIENVIESLDRVNDLTMIKILEIKECVNTTLERIRSYLKESSYTPEECLCIYLDTIESVVQGKVKETKQLAERHLTEAENQLNRALSDANYYLVFSLKDIKLELNSRLNDAEESIKGSVRSIDWDQKIAENVAENCIFPALEGIKKSVEKQLDETQNWTEKSVNVAKKYFTTLMTETKDLDGSPMERISANLLVKIHEIGAAVQTAFENAMQRLKMPDNQSPEIARNILRDIDDNTMRKIDEINQFVLDSFIHAKALVQDNVDASGNSLKCYIEELQSNIVSEIVDIEEFLHQSLEKATNEISRGEVSYPLVQDLHGIPEKIQNQLTNVTDYLITAFGKIRQSLRIVGEVDIEVSQVLPFKSIEADIENRLKEIIMAVEESFETGKNHLRGSMTQESLTNILENIDSSLKHKIGEVTNYIHDAFKNAENYLEEELNIKEEPLPRLLDELKNDVISKLKKGSDFANSCVKEAKYTIEMPTDGTDDRLLKAFDEMSTKIQNRFSNTKESIKASLEKAEFDVGELLMNSGDRLRFVLINLSEKLGSEIKATEETVERLFENAKRDVQKSGSTNKEHLSKILDDTNNVVKDSISKTVKSVETIFYAAEESLKNKINEVDDSALKAVGEVKAMVLSEIKGIAEFMDLAHRNAECTFKSHRRGSEDFLSFSFDGVLMKLRNKMGKMKENVKQELRKIRQTQAPDFKEENQSINTIVSNANKNIKSKINEIGETINTSLENAISSLKSPDDNTQETLLSSIINETNKIKTDVRNIFDSLQGDVIKVGGKCEGPLKHSLQKMIENVEDSIDRALGFAENRLEEAKSNLQMTENGVDDSLLPLLYQISKDIQCKLTETQECLDISTSKVLDYFKLPIRKTAMSLNAFINESKVKINSNIKDIESTLKTSFENSKTFLQEPKNRTQESLLTCLENINIDVNNRIHDLENSLDDIFDISKINLDHSLTEDNNFRNALGQFKGVVKSAMYEIGKSINGHIGRAKSSMKMPKDGVDDTLLSSFDAVAQKIQTDIDKTKESVKTTSDTFVDNMKSSAKETEESVTHSMKMPKDDVDDTLLSSFDAVAQKIQTDIDKTKESVKTTSDTFVDNMKSSAKETEESVTHTLSEIDEIIKLNIQDIDRTLVTSFEEAKTYLQKPGNNTQADFQKCLEDINNSLQTKIQETEKSLGKLFNSLSLDVDDLSVSEKEHIASTVNHLKESMGNLIAKKKQIVSGCLDKAKSSLQTPEEGSVCSHIHSLDGIRGDIQMKLNEVKSTETTLLGQLQQDVLSTVDVVADVKQNVEDSIIGVTNAIGIPGLKLNAGVWGSQFSAGAQTKVGHGFAKMSASVKAGGAQNPSTSLSDEQNDQSPRQEGKWDSKEGSGSFGPTSGTSEKLETTVVKKEKQTEDSVSDSNSDSDKKIGEGNKILTKDGND